MARTRRRALAVPELIVRKREGEQLDEQEIRDVQEQMYQDEDTEYFRQLEADRLRGDLQVASYKTMI